MKRILVLEPYYGGSHKHFLEGLQKHIQAEYVSMTLPARKWKMRMQLSAPWFIAQIIELPAENRWFDTILCSSFIDLAVLRALLVSVAGWNPHACVCLYFHENQMIYPQREKGNEGYEFASINFHSALVADKIAFNSSYNAETFFEGCRKYLQAASSEFKLPGIVEELRGKSCILFPGIDFQEIDKSRRKRDSKSPVIVWNHRWEHDKNPERFYQGLSEIERRGVPFQLIVVGESFRTVPDCFEQIKRKFASCLIHFGFAPCYKDYVNLLSQGDLVVSTALHEFYGIAIIEAVRAGCVPLLPNRLSYPELFDNKYLYDEIDFPEKLELALAQIQFLGVDEIKSITEKFSWQKLSDSYREWLFG